ncbi:uncharacterized protein [Dysidea avara]|uniref:uncharacterized protein n=1 Tax=Dysidea avara TaxID=196820 RepID=UPI00332A4EAC
MKILIVAAVLVAVCYAQPPPPPVRPVIPETFDSGVEVTYHEQETRSGRGYIARNQAKNEGVEDLYAVVEGKNESRIRLERYDMGEEYYIRGSGTDEHCEMRKTNGTTLPPYWGWVKDAHYYGQRKVREETLEVWEYDHGPGVRFEVLVNAENVNVPRYLNSELGSDRREITFQKFDAIAPQEALFVVPKVCGELL